MFINLPTGFGKSLIYQVQFDFFRSCLIDTKCLKKSGHIVVVSPLIYSFMKDQVPDRPRIVCSLHEQCTDRGETSKDQEGIDYSIFIIQLNLLCTARRKRGSRTNVGVLCWVATYISDLWLAYFKLCQPPNCLGDNKGKGMLFGFKQPSVGRGRCVTELKTDARETKT